MKYVCMPCGHIYDEEVEGIRFKKLPKDWRCPRCGAPKTAFEPVEESKQALAGNG